ncbi:DUF5058 family protein [Lachnoclostridium sp. Marseille-P6806]|uniref:DUF5058 family protein n=1 Tax=Lachnoclostridium sp. Marseille-P6806 TaxID=2364793 RepID=UPI0013EF1A31|nr:DUF5058 family protein [Lachnoclostridium sp. Marseille-P6806]
MQEQLNSPVLYLICGAIILFVAAICVIFLFRAWRAGLAIGMEPGRLRRAVTSSAAFTVLPSVGILLGVIALSGSLGTPWPWLRLSVIGALHYETQVAQAAAEQVGIGGLSAQGMTPRAFATIALLMSGCIMWGMVLSLFFNRRYTEKLGTKEENAKKGKKGFADTAMTAMFIGLISCYLGSYIGGAATGSGIVPLAVCAASAAAMALFTALSKHRRLSWLESFSVAGSMLIGMLAAVVLA